MTICAISTAPGIGGIAVIRVSGNDAFAICDTIFRPFAKNLTVQKMAANSVHFGQILSKNEVVDEVLVTVFHAPHSFTGENVVEISCHGSLFVQQEILKLLLENGCRMARAGEFTQRAFLNGKMDLSQAEAVADLIASQSRSAHRLAMNQMRGGFSNELMQLRDKLLNFTSLIELELDFADHEELEFADRSQLHALANEIETKIAHLAHSFSIGNAIKNGIPVAIVGATNAGKSTLLNALVGDERAIVSDIHGTTRDVIEETMNLNGVLFRFIDTAGLRQTTDTIENLGIERSYNAIDHSNIVLFVLDCTKLNEIDAEMVKIITEKSQNKQLILVYNKFDQANETEAKNIKNQLKIANSQQVAISAKHKHNLLTLQQMIFEAAKLPEIGENDITVTNLRHYEALNKALEAIRRVQNGLNNNISGDFLSIDLRDCLQSLGEITGQITTDEILGNIFSKFCIGK